MDLNFSKMPWYAQIGTFVVLAVGGMGAFYYFYEMPAQEALTTQEKRLNGLRDDLTKGLATARKLPEFRAQVEELETRLTSLRAVLPEEKDAADLLRRMQTVAAQSNLTIKSFKPAPVVTRELHAEWPITLELDGTYHNLAMFFDRVGKFTRIINISGLSVRGKDKPDPNSTISATCIATTFVLIEPSAGKIPAAKKAA
jgi:type IV pilus assembly protein PilO